MNNYISKYAKYDTHFNRVDAWKHTKFSDAKDVIDNSLALFAFVACVVVGAVIYYLLSV